MTTEQIKNGMALLVAARAECEAMVETARSAIRYCYDREAESHGEYPDGYIDIGTRTWEYRFVR